MTLNRRLDALSLEMGKTLRGSTEVCTLRVRGLKNKEKIDERTSRLIYVVAGRASGVSRSLLEMHTAVEDLILCTKMLRKYPWHKTEVTKLKHFELTWFLFQNLCYKFKEKLKLYHNWQKSLSQTFGLQEPGWLKAELKLIERALGPAIRDRGRTIHEWDEKHSSIDWFGTVSFLDQLAQQGVELDLPTGFSDVAGHYRDAKRELNFEAKKMCSDAIGIFDRVLRFHAPLPEILLSRSQEMLDAVNNGHQLQEGQPKVEME